MSYHIDYWDKEGQHLGQSSLLNFTGKVYTPEYLENMAKQEMADNYFPNAVEYDISEQEADVPDPSKWRAEITHLSPTDEE